MSEESKSKFNLKIDVTELNDKSFSFKIEGFLPVAVKDAIATAIVGLKEVGPKVAENIVNLQVPAAQQTEKAKEKFNAAIIVEKVKIYLLTKTAQGSQVFDLEQAAKDLELTPAQVFAAYQLLVKEGVIKG